MLNFVFKNPTKIIFGKNQIANIAYEIPKNKKILLTYGGGSIKKNSVYDQAMNALKDHTVFEFGGIEPNPKLEQLLQALPLIKKNNIDFLLAVGGGSVIDGTKFIAAASLYKEDPWNIVTNSNSIADAMPLGCILTLPATGSEMNGGAVISKQNSPDKLAFSHELLFPKFSILDPSVTFTLPAKQTANGIIDTFVHVTEQYLTYPVNAKLQDRFAEGILLTLIEEAPKVFSNPYDYDSRANLMWCSTWGLNGAIRAGVPNDWATHRLGHEITAKFGLDHSETLAIILPSLLNIKRKQKQEKILQCGQRVFGINTGTVDEKINKTIAEIRAFFEKIGLKTTLSDYNIPKESIASLISQLKKHGLTALGEHADIDLAQSELIYNGCF